MVAVVFDFFPGMMYITIIYILNVIDCVKNAKISEIFMCIGPDSELFWVIYHYHRLMKFNSNFIDLTNNSRTGHSSFLTSFNPFP